MEGSIRNPLTNRWIRVGGPTYLRLVREGILEEESTISKEILQGIPEKASFPPKGRADPDRVVSEIYALFPRVLSDPNFLLGSSDPSERILEGKTEDRISQKCQTRGLLCMKVQVHPSCYGLSGDTFFVRKILPRNTSSTGKEHRPVFDYEHGHRYTKNAINRRKLWLWILTVEKINQKYEGYAWRTRGPQNRAFGLIGWEVPYEDPPWLITLLGSRSCPRHNPIRRKDGVWLFQKSAFDSGIVSKTCKFLKNASKQGVQVWHRLYPTCLTSTKKGKGCSVSWTKFLEIPEGIAAVAAWGEHARFIYKDDRNKTVYLYDPWKRDLHSDPFVQLLVRTFPLHRWVFVPRKAEQGKEGSCAILAILRAVLVAEFGKEGAIMEIPCTYAVMVSRIMSRLRKEGKIN